MRPDPGTLEAAFRIQARGCALAGSPIYEALLLRAADDLAANGPFVALVDGYRGNPVTDALPLRLLGAVHRLVLEGRVPDLASFYPSAGGRFHAEGAWRALRDVASAHRDELRAAAATTPVQTNEVRRSAALLGGYLRVAQQTGLPLRVREIGASAGLNLRWDHYRYALGSHRWGASDASVSIETDWTGPPPDLGVAVRVASRAGCDPSPLDVCDPEQCARLEAFVWPDHLDRLALLRAALRAARADPPRLEARRADEWVAVELALPHAGEALVLSQSVMWLYLTATERATVTETVRSAGQRATADAPLAWLRLEGIRLEEAELRLQLFPGGEDRLLAGVSYHGRWVRWEG